jgi:hypothetical protein
MVYLNASNLAPYQHIMVNFVPADNGMGASFTWAVQADEDGIVAPPYNSLKMQNADGNYTASLLVPGCSVSPPSTNILVSQGNSQQACNGVVTIQPEWNVSSTTNGTALALNLKITNTNVSSVLVNLPSLTLPQGILSVSPVGLTNVTVNGQSTLSLSFPVSAVNTSVTDILAILAIPPGYANYVCGNTQYPAGGGQATITIRPPAAPLCGLEIVSFAFLPGGIDSGQPALLQLKIKNTGSSPITNLGFLGGLRPIGSTGGANAVSVLPLGQGLALNGVTLQPGGEVTTSANIGSLSLNPVTAVGTVTNYTVTISTGELNGQCAGATITSNGSASATVAITKI